MDPNEFAMTYDKRIRRTLDFNSDMNRIRSQILERCLEYQRKDLLQGEIKCIES